LKALVPSASNRSGFIVFVCFYSGPRKRMRSIIFVQKLNEQDEKTKTDEEGNKNVMHGEIG